MAVFLFTDIEGSTQKWEKYKDLMPDVLAKHDAILNENIEHFGGKIIKHTGDGVFAVFEDGDSLQSALEIQKGIENMDWGDIGELRVRIGLHSGKGEKRGEDYFGTVVNRTARVMTIGWGGQIILTPEVKETAKLPKGAVLENLGVHLLKDLYEPQQIYGLIHPDLKLKKFPPLRSLSSHPNNLPIQSTPFMGREKELSDITKLINNPSCRLITLVGPGGTGKTRLAIQAAAETIRQFKNGVYFIPLDPLSSTDFLISTIADALNFSFYSKEDEAIQLLNYLREKEILLILDNFEHLVKGARIISDILKIASKIKILVTSRELLNLKGEWIVQVEGMDFPEGEGINVEGCGAVQLFFHSAHRVTNITFSDEDKQFVIRICQLVGGLPLGIEIASSWLRALSCKEIAKEIEKNVDFLSTSLRDVPERHRSLRAVFDYSWDFLSDEEKDMFMKLSVFQGGFTREAAEKVTDISITMLTSFMDKSLIRKIPEGRYEMAEIIRQFANEKLRRYPDIEEKIKNLHSTYFADFLHKREEDILSVKAKETKDEIKREIKNIRLAWSWAVEKKMIVNIDRAVDTLYNFYDIMGKFQEGEKCLVKAIETFKHSVLDNTLKVYGKLLSKIGSFYYHLGDYSKAREYLNESISISEKLKEEKDKAFSLYCLTRIEALLGNYENAEKLGKESLKIYEEIKDRYGVPDSLNAIGVIYYYLKRFNEAKQLFEKSLEFSTEMGYQKGISTAFGNIGLVAYETGNYDEAKRLLMKGFEMDRKMGDRMGMANNLHNIGLTYKTLKDYENAKKYYEQALAIRREIGDRMGISISFNNLGNLGGFSVDYDDAIGFHKEALTIRKEIGDKMGIAQSLLNMGEIFSHIEKDREAKEHYYEALVAAVDSKENFVIKESLTGVAEYLVKEGKKEMALGIFLFLHHYDREDKEFQERMDELIDGLRGELPQEIFNSVKEKIKTQNLEDVVGGIIGQLMDDE